MHEFELSGSYYEIGHALGSMLKEKLIMDLNSKDLLEGALECEKAIRKFTPGLREEVQGCADALGCDYELLITYVYVENPTSWWGCNLFAIPGEFTTSGKTIFVRHMDWIEADLKYFTKLITNPAEGLRSLSFNFGSFGRTGGINEAGLAIGEASIPFYTGEKQNSILYNLAARWVIDNYGKTKDAAEFLLKIPHSKAISFLIADKHGTVARVECSPEKSAASFLKDEIMVASNFFHHKEMSHLENMPKEDRAYKYYNNIQKWYTKNKGKITPATVKEVCRGHETGICEHWQDEGMPPALTIWSWIAELGTNTLESAEGSPCKNEYKTLQF